MILKEFLYINNFKIEKIILENVKTGKSYSFDNELKISNYFKRKKVICFLETIFNREMKIYIS